MAPPRRRSSSASGPLRLRAGAAPRSAPRGAGARRRGCRTPAHGVALLGHARPLRDEFLKIDRKLLGLRSQSGRTAPSGWRRAGRRRARPRAGSARRAAGGGTMRCSAARTSPTRPRRASSERRMARSEVARASSAPRFRRRAPRWPASARGLDQRLVEPGAVGADLADLLLDPGAGGGVGALALLGGLEFGVALGARCSRLDSASRAASSGVIGPAARAAAKPSARRSSA